MTGANDTANAVKRMQEYMDAHITQPITLKQLAQAAGYSPYYSAHLFREMTGKAPFDYLRQLRLSRAAVRLRDGQERVLDVALDFAFDSHEGFTRAFSKTFGLSPKRYRDGSAQIRLFMPSYVTAESLNRKCYKEGTKVSNEKLSPVFIQVMERPRRKLLLKRGKKATEYFEYCGEVGCDLWDVLCGVKEALYEPVGMWLPEKLIKEGTSKYIQGVEVPLDYAGDVPQGCEVIELEPCKVMVFQGAPYDDEEYGTEVGKVMEYIDGFDPTIYGYAWADEDAPRFQLAPMGYRGYIEARPVRLVK